MVTLRWIRIDFNDREFPRREEREVERIVYLMRLVEALNQYHPNTVVYRELTITVSLVDEIILTIHNSTIEYLSGNLYTEISLL